MSRSRWYYDHDGRTGGPVSVAELRDLAANGDLRPTDRVRKEDMDRWVKARAVKGLFNPGHTLTPLAEPAATDSAFDFFGVGPLAAAEPANEFHPAFDFFAGPQPPAEVELHPVVPPPVPKTKPAQIPIAKPAPQPVKDDSGTFQVTVPMASPTHSRDEDSVPYADFHAEVPMAMPASAIVPAAPPVSAELTGPEVVGGDDGTVRRTGDVVTWSLSGGWLAIRSTAPDGTTGEAYLRLRQLTVVTFCNWPGVGLTLTFHAGSQAVSIECDGDVAAARAFLQRVLDSQGEPGA